MTNPTIRTLATGLLAIALTACGDAVTDPSLEGFEADPRPVRGAWVTLFEEADGTVLRLDGELTPASGRFLGSFEFRRFGQDWRIQFNDGTWDGTRVRFDADMTVFGTPQRVEWAATYFPSDGSEPAMLLLSSDPFGGAGNPIVYLRPSDAPASATGPPAQAR